MEESRCHFSRRAKNEVLENFKQLTDALIFIKVMEQLILEIMNNKKIIWSNQHGFSKV